MVANGTGAVDVVGVAGVADDFGVVLGAGVADTFDVVVAGVFWRFRRCWWLGLVLSLRRGCILIFFSLFRGPLFLPVYLGPALLFVCFGLDLTRALGLRLFADGGGGAGGC